MDLSLFPRGLVIGLAIAAPGGPIGVLCIRRSLTEGRAIGFATGLGAATADALYAALAALGLTAVGRVMSEHADWIRLIGGLALCYLGLKTLRSAPAVVEAGTGPPAHRAGDLSRDLADRLQRPATRLYLYRKHVSRSRSRGRHHRFPRASAR